MALREIKEQILKEAEQKASAVEAEGKAQASSILSEAKENAKRIAEQSKKGISAKVELMKREHKAGIEIERHNALLIAKEGVVDSYVGRISRETSSRLMHEHYDKIVKNALNAARDLIGNVGIVIRADKESQKMLKKLGQVSELSSEKGVVIQTRNGSVKIDASIESAMHSNMELIRSRIADELFAEHKSVSAKKRAPAKKAKVAKKAGTKKRGK